MAENEDLFGVGSPNTEQADKIDDPKAKEYVSAWIKSLRLGRLEDAFYWLNVMAKYYDEWYVARRMAAFAGEDCWDQQAIVLTSALWTLVDRKAPDIWNHINFTNWYLCQCPKFWNTDGGIEFYRMFIDLEKRFKDDGEGGIEPEEVPSWAIDMHTATGREAAKNKEWDKVDQRFSGTEVGIYSRILMWKRLGRLDPDGGMDDYWKAHGIVKSYSPKKG